MNTNLIIESAAKRAGNPLPLDGYDHEFGEGLLQSLGDSMDWVYGRKPIPSGENFFERHSKLVDEAEALRSE
jgi:hypothetical protein